MCALTNAFAVCGWSLRSPWSLASLALWSLASLALWSLREVVFLFGLLKPRWIFSCVSPASACRSPEFCRALSCPVPPMNFLSVKTWTVCYLLCVLWTF
ncbi:hypothetical protein NPIL_48851 [Nephila pilipes]|uniref:Uncharacterized protein n=1 Tax=Nephila pilipes TaxID=299642 RepID=A0A8X6NC21_NEPPI|nr:hypothetical protein NPIL_48851 [Nephila pilipes]